MRDQHQSSLDDSQLLTRIQSEGVVIVYLDVIEYSAFEQWWRQLRTTARASAHRLRLEVHDAGGGQLLIANRHHTLSFDQLRQAILGLGVRIDELVAQESGVWG